MPSAARASGAEEPSAEELAALAEVDPDTQHDWEGVKKRRVFWRMEAAIAEVVATRAPGAHIVPSGAAGGDAEELQAEEDRESAVHARPELTWGGEKDGGKKRKKKRRRDG